MITNLLFVGLLVSAIDDKPILNEVNTLIAKHEVAVTRYDSMIEAYNKIWKDVPDGIKANMAVETKATDSLLTAIYWESMSCLHSNSNMKQKACGQAKQHLEEVTAEITEFENTLKRLTEKQITAR